MDQVVKLRKASEDRTDFEDTAFDLDDREHRAIVDRTFRLSSHQSITKDMVTFMVDGSQSSDINQGGLGDCWFLAALSCIATKDQPGTEVAKIKEDTIQTVLQVGFNKTMMAEGTGGFKFKFFRMGEWVDVVIDDKLPLRRRARPSDSGEWWVPLTEKAYAKFNGGYDKIQGGQTGRAMTDLSGGIAVDMNDFEYGMGVNEDNTISGINLVDLLKKIQRNALICTSNRDGAGNEQIRKGLVSGHAYSLLAVDTMTLSDGSKKDMVKIRNPWGRTEWTGDWSDKDTANWSRVSAEEKRRLKMDQASDDGAFWMDLRDWVDEFENLAICALPGLDINDPDGIISEEEMRNRDHRVNGTFRPGENAPVNTGHLCQTFRNPAFSTQVELTVGAYGESDTRLIWLQVLTDTPLKENRLLMVNFWAKRNDDSEFDGPQTSRNFRRFKKIEPIIPASPGYNICVYQHNGFLLNLNPGKYLITLSSCMQQDSTEPTDFMVRAMGANLKLRPLTSM